MSNLIVRPSSALDGAAPQSSQPEVTDLSIKDGIKLDDIWRALLRRRKLALITASAVFTISLINAVYQRIANPVFAGAFTLLISDPLSDKRSGSSEGERFEQMARNTTSNDIHLDTGVAQPAATATRGPKTQHLCERPCLPDHHQAGWRRS